MSDKQLEIIQQLEEIPISIYDKSGCCLKMYPEIPYINEFNLSNLSERTEFTQYTSQVTCLLTDSLLLIGFIPDIANKKLIILGPVSTVPLNSCGLRQITEHLSTNYSQDLVKTVTGLLSSMKLMDIDRFRNIMALTDSITNGEIHEIRTFQGNSLNTTQSNAIKKMTSAINAEVTFDDHDFTDTDIQDRILFYISKGMVEDLEQIEIPDFIMEMMRYIDLRRAKNSMIVLNSLSQRAALAAGVPLRATDSLGRAFSDQIESCPDIDALNQLSARMFIPAAYARLVRDVNVPGNTSRDIRTVIIYVQNHFREQITVRFLAEMVNLSEAHLSRKFKAETGMTLKDFITTEKIHEAEALLRFTDLSLAAISELLSFSSQSWFQTSFKKHTGQTPMDYRRNILLVSSRPTI